MQVLSSLSGLQFSAASAGFAPTNSGDVSAIASAYQVVSATATQLYAGSAYLTSVNSAPVSAARAGNAANASMANSAYYDGTGRLISSLPDSAAVSSIASSYAESAASSKLDSTSQVVTATAGDGTYVTSINGMGLSGEGGGGAQVVTATGSASAMSGWYPYTTSYLVSSINGSAILPYGYSAISANSANWNSTRYTVNSNSANWNSVYNTVSNNSASWSGSTGGSVVSPSGTIVVLNGDEIEGTNSAVLTASSEGFETSMSPLTSQLGTLMRFVAYGDLPSTGATLLIPLEQAAYTDIQVILSGRGPYFGLPESASGLVRSGDYMASIPLDRIMGDISASASNWFDLSGGAYITARKDGGIQVTGIGELAWNSALTGVSSTVANNSASWGQGGVAPATVSAIASAYAESAVSGVEGTVSANSASWGQNGVDSATVSAIASSYAESAVSSKLDTTAYNSGDFYSTSNPSSFVDSAYVDSAVSGKLDATAFNSSDFYLTSNPSGFLTSVDLSDYATTGYVDSAVSGKQDTLTFDWDANSAISSINGSALAGQGGGGGGISVQTASARTMYSGASSAVTGFSGISGVGPVVLRSGTVVAGNMRMQLGGIGNLVPYRSSQDYDQNYKWSTGNILLLSGNQGYGYYKGHQLWLCHGTAATSHRISFDVNNTTADVMVYQYDHSAVITPTGFSIWGPTTNAADRRNIDSAVYDRWNSYSAKQDALAFAYNTANQISSINGSALGGGGGGGGGGSLTPFYAEYGTTTFDDIDNAFRAGRPVYLRTDYGERTWAFCSIDNENDTVTFGGLYGSGLYYYENHQGSWTSGTK